ncbi:hypothetical protein CH373_10895 [Leptospira perolatii]|uniref:Uncharacterized protein n=1 Tax=Leptospira perolatii TaxID=2023191 RepID=A0A2M9ZLZ4_9LEPT|nr:hypothetical protein [Leptospira perolatii]PJZ69781.1 hypothetical protein CH360_09340 [Leptospira perolatii]PJZ73004.1 hypothetical protein CH373_10895 [Leptospira perolatii]
MISKKEPEYILVDSIKEIDPNRISLAQLGNKYMDRQGNRFAVRFNKEKRKAELVRITLQKISDALPSQPHRPKTSVKHGVHLDLDKLSNLLKSTKHPAAEWVDSLAEKVIQHKEAITSKKESSDKPGNGDVGTTSEAVPTSPQVKTAANAANSQDLFDLSKVDLNIMDRRPASSNTQAESDVPSFIESDSNPDNEAKFIQDIVKEFNRVRERIESVLNNIRNSKVFEVTGDPSENKNIIGNMNREYDIEFFQKFDKAVNYYKELTSFPRSITYYISKYESSRRQELQSRSTDQDRLSLVIRWEMQEMLSSLAIKLKKMILNTLNALNTKNENHLKQVPYNQQQMFRDARSALLYCSDDITALVISLQKWIENDR